MLNSLINVQVKLVLIESINHKTPYVVSSKRFLHQSAIQCSQSLNSNAWKQRHVNDEYVKRARYENFRARSAYKLLEINDKHNLIRPGQVVIDLGASPGSWTQVATRLMGLNREFLASKSNKHTPDNLVRNGFVVAIDLLPIAPIDGAITLGNVDFTSPLNQAKILRVLGDRPVDLVLSDMAPNASGTQQLDHDRILELSLSALQFAIQVLRPKTGNFLVKLWDGNQVTHFENHFLKKFFHQVLVVKPQASRVHSAELFLLAKQFRGLSR